MIRELGSKSSVSHVSILGVPVHLVNMDSAVQEILRKVEREEAGYICVRDVHGLMRSTEDPRLMDIHHSAGMVVPDGMPIVWLAKLRSKKEIGRVCGPDLVEALCEAGETIGLRHFFCGGKPGVAEAMSKNLKSRYPGLSIAGVHSPLFRPPTEEEDEALIESINESRANVVWVGLGTPKQEFWMRDHVGRIKGAILIGVGAAFDFHSGAVARAPKWMQHAGLEWLYRLAQEPGRLWRRYLIIAPLFLLKVIREQLNVGFQAVNSTLRRQSSRKGRFSSIVSRARRLHG